MQNISWKRFAVAFFVLDAFGWSQTGTGSIQGTVKDATDAVVPGAKVTLVHTPTTRQYTTASNEVGFYLFPPAQMGPYQITVEAPGMDTWKGELTLTAPEEMH